MLSGNRSSDSEPSDSGSQTNSRKLADNLFVKNINSKVSDLDLRGFFSQYGRVSDVTTQRAEGDTFYAYITYQNKDHSKCIDNIFT